jgi:hypothetical protein
MVWNRVWTALEKTRADREEEKREAARAGVPINNIPNYPYLYSPRFLGVLDVLEQRLQRGRWVALTGMPGAGKTYTAFALADRLRLTDRPIHTLLVPARDEERFQAGLVDLARPDLLHLPFFQHPRTRSEIEPRHLERVKRWLSQRGNWLLVLDNMDGCFHDPARFAEMKACLPDSADGRILLTTRDTSVQVRAADPRIDTFSVELMGEAEGAQFLLDRAGLPAEGNREAAQRISALVGGLALALDQAAAYILARIVSSGGAYPLVNYLRDYEEVGSAVRATSGLVGEHDPTHTTFQLLFEQLNGAADGSERVLAAVLLRLCAVIDPEAIPLRILDEYGEGAGIADRGQIRKAIWTAATHRILDYDPGSETIRLHRVVHRFLVDLVASENTEMEWRLRAEAAVDRALADVEMIPPLYSHIGALGPKVHSEEAPRLKMHWEDREVLDAVLSCHAPAGRSGRAGTSATTDGSHQPCVERR